MTDWPAVRQPRFPTAVWTLVCLGWLVVTWTWRDLYLAMTVDDTFYYIKTALNAARGLGSSFDGVNPTNGYHPMWLALLSGIFTALPDDVVLLTRVVFTIQVAMVWGGGLLLTRLREAGGPLVLWPLALALSNPVTAKIVLCGQETALQFFLSCAVLSSWWSVRSSPRATAPSWAALPLLCSLLALSRLDSAFYCGFVLAMPLLLPGESEDRDLHRRIVKTLRGLALFALLMAPYLLFNLITYHHLMPVSGAIKLRLDDDEVAAPAARVLASAVAVSAIVLTWLSARRSGSRELALLLPPLGAVCVLAVYNFGLRGEMSPSLIRIWYLEPHLLLGSLAGGLLLARYPGLHGRGRRAAAAVAGGVVLVWLVFAGLSWRYRLEPRSYSLYVAAESCSRFLQDKTEPKAVAAAWDAGFVGAFTRKPVMNLDGLINSWEFKGYLDRGAVDEFVFERHPVDYVVQYAWPRSLAAFARRFKQRALPLVPERRTTTAGSQEPAKLSGRWGVDLASFHVVHVECVMVSVTYDPRRTTGPVNYLVLSRAAVPGTPTLAEFAVANAGASSCSSQRFVP